MAARLPAVERAPCVLINPRSFAASRGSLAQRATQTAAAHGAEVVFASDSAQIDAAAARLLHRGHRLVVVLAGDGTVRAVADRLASGTGDTSPPLLLALGGGRTNLTAAELGGAGGVLAKLDAALQRFTAGLALATEERDLLEISQASVQPRRGFALGAGFVDYAIRACHRDRTIGDGKLRQGTAGTAWSLAKLALPAIRGRLRPQLDRLRVEVPGAEALADPAHLLLVTTLRRRQGALDPFADRGAGAMRYTAIAAGGVGFCARLPWLATGRFRRDMDAAHGYLSGRCDELRVIGLSSYTLDGEEYSADPSRPVLIRRGPRLTFVTP